MTAAPAIAESKSIAIEAVLKLNFKGDAALKLDAEVEVAAAAPVGVPVPEPAGVIELEGAVAVTPKPEELLLEEAAADFVDEPELDLLPELNEDKLLEDELLEDELLCAPMENEPLVEYTLVMLPSCTASKVNPPPAGTRGNSRLRDWDAVVTVLAMANESWKFSFNSSKVKVDGSPAPVDHVIVTWPPEVGLLGMLSVNAETRGTTNVKAASLGNILVFRIV